MNEDADQATTATNETTAKSAKRGRGPTKARWMLASNIVLATEEKFKSVKDCAVAAEKLAKSSEGAFQFHAVRSIEIKTSVRAVLS
jgi:hypothetical protein